MVAFGVMLTMDGGQSILGQAGRVHEQYEGQGIFGSLSRQLNYLGRENGSKKRVALVETSLNKYARSERFRKAHIPVASKLQYTGLITDDIRGTIGNKINFDRDKFADIIPVETKVLSQYFRSEQIRTYLFSRGRLIADYVPLCVSPENLDLLHGRSTSFHSNIDLTYDSDITGLLSAGTTFKCSNPPESYTIDIFGTESVDLERHVLFHLSRAFEKTYGPFCLQIFVEEGYIAEALCKTLVKYNIPKCNWYVQGGVTTKTIVEETLC